MFEGGPLGHAQACRYRAPSKLWGSRISASGDQPVSTRRILYSETGMVSGTIGTAYSNVHCLASAPVVLRGRCALKGNGGAAKAMIPMMSPRQAAMNYLLTCGRKNCGTRIEIRQSTAQMLSQRGGGLGDFLALSAKVTYLSTPGIKASGRSLAAHWALRDSLHLDWTLH
jgi:hypothetical protein